MVLKVNDFQSFLEDSYNYKWHKNSGQNARKLLIPIIHRLANFM